MSDAYDLYISGAQEMKDVPCHILAWGTYDLGKPRTRILLRGLREQGVKVTECHVHAWEGIEDKSRMRFVGMFLMVLKMLFLYPNLLWRYLFAPRHDFVLVGYLGLFDVLLLWPFAKLRGGKILWDAFIPVYNMVVEDRCLLIPGNLPARLLFWCEKLAAKVADLVILDTEAHRNYFTGTFAIQRKHTAVVFVGVEPEYFPPADVAMPSTETLTVLFYGQFIPLHGIETIIQAARLAREEDIHWVVIGDGQMANKVESILKSEHLPRLRWIRWANYETLVDWIYSADVCLGVFGDSAKAARVIPNKVFQILHAGRSLITQDSVAIRELLNHDPPAVQLVPPNDAGALLAAVRQLGRERDRMVGSFLHQTTRLRITPEAVGAQFLSAINAFQRDCEEADRRVGETI